MAGSCFLDLGFWILCSCLAAPRIQNAQSKIQNRDGGWLHEVFTGIQGEGLHVGERQVFVRLAGCNLACAYCDTPQARARPPSCRVEQTPGLRDFAEVPNPLTPTDAAACVARLETFPGLHHSVSLTGGEPLVQAEFATALARELKARGFRVFLETNGTLPDALTQLLPWIDIISMDMKLPSTTGVDDLLRTHIRFLQIAVEREVYVKIVVSSETTMRELEGACEAIASVDEAIPLVLQPVTPRSGVTAPSPAQVLGWQERCKLHLRSVRVIPQCHKVIGQM